MTLLDLYKLAPKGLQRVIACLDCQYGRTNYVWKTGRWRVIDIIMTTGHNSDDRRLRELQEQFPEWLDVRGETENGSTFKTYTLKSPGEPSGMF